MLFSETKINVLTAYRNYMRKNISGITEKLHAYYIICYRLLLHTGYQFTLLTTIYLLLRLLIK